jgi:hypothetical protein
MRKAFKLCPSCGNFAGEFEPATYCIVCGTELIDSCRACGARIFYPTGRFCPECGKSLLDVPDDSAARRVLEKSRTSP